jgi:hypothetical protein
MEESAWAVCNLQLDSATKFYRKKWKKERKHQEENDSTTTKENMQIVLLWKWVEREREDQEAVEEPKNALLHSLLLLLTAAW